MSDPATRLPVHVYFSDLWSAFYCDDAAANDMQIRKRMTWFNYVMVRSRINSPIAILRFSQLVREEIRLDRKVRLAKPPINLFPWDSLSLYCILVCTSVRTACPMHTVCGSLKYETFARMLVSCHLDRIFCFLNCNFTPSFRTSLLHFAIFSLWANAKIFYKNICN